MSGLLRDVLARRGIAGLAIVLAAALALSALARSLIDIAIVLPLSHADQDLAFAVEGTKVYYGELLANGLALALLVAALLGIWRLGRDRTRVCPDCRSDVDFAATICPMCTSEIGPA
jgi:hypothetical protein